MNVSNTLLAAIFAETAHFCGREDVIQAIIYHQMLKAGISPQRVAREQTIGKNRVDIVLFGEEVKGDFATTQCKPIAAIEVKGGAYGDRNALKDEIDSTGFCKDMTKLKVDAGRGIECWFLCVDMPELGRAISPLKVGFVSEQCAAQGLSFAYYCQGDEYFYSSRPGQQLIRVPIITAGKVDHINNGLQLFDRIEPKLVALSQKCLSVNGHEANNTGLLYDCLRTVGFGVSQVSLETYFSFAAKVGNRMQDRPDLVVFDADFDGRFNLYKEGNTRRSNDGHKLSHIDTIFEVKGSAAMTKKSDKAILDIYLADIQKLKLWRDSAKIVQESTSVRTVFFGVDGRHNGLQESSVATLVQECQLTGSGLIYMSRNRLEAIRPEMSLL